MKVHVLLLLVFLSLSISCSTGPEFKRGNTNDPSSATFSPDISNLTATIRDDKSVVLSWQDESIRESGFIIWKQLGADSTLIVLDTLRSNITNYIDVSGKIDINTNYYLVAYKDMGDTLSTSIPLKQKLEFGTLAEASYSSSNGNTIKIEWTDLLAFYDQITISKLKKNGTTEVLDTLYDKTNSFTYTDLEEVYETDIQITAHIINSLGHHQTVSTINLTGIAFNLPENFNASVIDEGTINVTWKDETPFEETFIIYQRPVENQFSTSNAPFTPIDTLSTPGAVKIAYYEGIFYDFSIAPLKNETIGATAQPVLLTIVSTPPDIISVKGISETELELNWVDRNVTSTSIPSYQTVNFIVEKAVNNGSYTKLATLDRSITTLTVSDLDKDNSYKFRLRSLSSKYDETKVSYAPSLVENNKFYVPSNDWLTQVDMTPLGTYYVYEYSHSAGAFGLKLLNKKTGYVEKHLYFDSESHGFSFSYDENYVAVFRGENPGVFDYNTSISQPIYSFTDNARGTFINNTDLILVENTSIQRVNFKTGEQLAEHDLKNLNGTSLNIYDLFKTKSDTKLFIRTNQGLMVYNYNTNETPVLISDLRYDSHVTDANNNGEILISNDKRITLLTDEGETLLEITKPSEINEYYFDFISAKFLSNSLIAVSSNTGIVLLFNKNTGEYLSYTQFLNKEGTERMHTDIDPFYIDNETNKCLAFIRNAEGLSRVFNLNENSWITTYYNQVLLLSITNVKHLKNFIH